MQLKMLTAHVSRGMLTARPGGTGAAEPFEPRQVREEATVRRYLWVPPDHLPGRILFKENYL